MRSCLILSLFFIGLTGHAQTLPHHQLRIVLHPEQHKLEAEDHISLPSGLPRRLDFSLHRDLHPPSPDAAIETVGNTAEEWLRRYRITLPDGRDSFTLVYGGEIFHPPQQDARESRTFENSPGILAAGGGGVSGGGGWGTPPGNVPGG